MKQADKKRGDLVAMHTAVITGDHLSPVAKNLVKHGFDIRVAHEGDKISSITVQDYSPEVTHMVYGLFSIATLFYKRDLKLNPIRFTLKGG